MGESVDFVSGAVDPDGTLRSQAWDLDGDGQFDDARGGEVLYTFTTPGVHTVRLRVEDDQGAAAIHERTVTVKRAPAAKAGFLTPAPVIRLNGQLLSSGSRITILSVRAPKGTLVTVKCHGKTCGVSQRRKRVKSGSVRFKTYERFLQGGRQARDLQPQAEDDRRVHALHDPGRQVACAHRPLLPVGQEQAVAPLLLTVPICTSGANR